MVVHPRYNGGEYMEVLIHKYRQKYFKDIVGDLDGLATLRVYLRKRDIPPIIILYGTNGTGKSTVASLMVKVMNCKHPTEDGDACGMCESCKAIDENLIGKRKATRGIPYHIFDLGGTHKQAEFMDEVCDTIKSTPFDCVNKYRFVLLEELQELSQDNQRC